MSRFLSEVADQLVRVDSEAYRREMERDVDTILYHFALPMSLPWTHKVGHYRVIARDIDELEGIIAGEEEFPGADRLGELEETRVCTIPEWHTLATRRDDKDPGIIRLTRCRAPQHFELPAGYPANGQESNLRKRRRVEILDESTEKNTVSICFGGSSSRSTLRPTSNSLIEPLVLSAKLPDDMTGISDSGTLNDDEQTRHLGSYDHRHGLPLSTTKQTGAARTRTIWTVKENQARKPIYKSLLTGRVLGNGGFRRPSEVKVCLRYNGRTLTLSQKGSSSPKRKTVTSSEDDCAGSGYSSRTIDTALEAAEEYQDRKPPPQNLQCTLDLAVYANRIKRVGDIESQFLDRMRGEYLLEMNRKDRLWLTVHPPHIWSQPCEDGVMQVVCTKTGEIKGVQFNVDHARESGIDMSRPRPYPWTTALFLDKMAKQHMACCICWSETDDEGDADLIICSSCHLQVHPKCYKGQKIFDPNWCCDSCVERRGNSSLLRTSLTATAVRWARKCALCPQFGSALSIVKTNSEPKGTCREWVHVGCQTWRRSNAFEDGVCIICSGKSQFLVKCAANGCSLKFHPMCATIASHASAIHRSVKRTFLRGSIEAREDRDIYLSTQYCQETVAVSYANKKSRCIPIAYCGLHNPNRAVDRIGLLPGAIFFNDAVCLPLQRDPVTAES